MRYLLSNATILIIILLTSVGCIDERSKDHYHTTVQVCEDCHRDLFVEAFTVYDGGVYGGQVKSDYLTDSLNFRIFIGSNDDNKFFSYHCNREQLVVETRDNRVSENFKILATKKYDINLLKKEGAFE